MSEAILIIIFFYVLHVLYHNGYDFFEKKNIFLREGKSAGDLYIFQFFSVENQ